MSDSYSFGSLAPQQANPTEQVPDFLSRIPRWLWPNIMGLAKGEPAPPLANMPSAPGKVPSTEDPRLAGALGEVANTAANVAPMLVPGGAAAGMAMRGAEAGLPRAAAALAGREAGSGFGSQAAVLPGLAMELGSSTEAEAAPKLTRQQQREMEMARQQQQIKSQSDAEAAALAAKTAREQAEIATGAERQRAMDAADAEQRKAAALAEIALKQQQDMDRQKREEAARQAALPYRKRHEDIASAMSNTGLAAAALLPYGSRVRAATRNNPFAREMESLTSRGEEALARGDLPTGRMLANQLSAMKKPAAAMQKQSSGGVGPGSFALSAALPFETSILPEAIDAVGGSPEAKAEALNTATDPMRAASILSGATMAGIGTHFPYVPGTRAMPMGRAEGMIKTYGQMQREENAAQKAIAAAQKAAGPAAEVKPPRAPRKRKTANPSNVVSFGSLAPNED